MTRNKLNRIAFVQFSENGKIYPTQCERNDIGEGDQVEVLMRANSDDAYYLEGSIVGITQERWNCRSRVENLISEVKYVPSKEGFLDRKVDLSARKTPDFSNWKSQKSDYFTKLPTSARNEMREIYNSVSNNDGEEFYLSDGVWITQNGTPHDKGI